MAKSGAETKGRSTATRQVDQPTEAQRLRATREAAVAKVLAYRQEHKKVLDAYHELLQHLVDSTYAEESHYRTHPEDAMPPFQANKQRLPHTGCDVANCAAAVRWAPDILKVPGVVTELSVDRVKELHDAGELSDATFKRIVTFAEAQYTVRVTAPEYIDFVKLPKKGKK